MGGIWPVKKLAFTERNPQPTMARSRQRGRAKSYTPRPSRCAPKLPRSGFFQPPILGRSSFGRITERNISLIPGRNRPSARPRPIRMTLPSSTGLPGTLHRGRRGSPWAGVWRHTAVPVRQHSSWVMYCRSRQCSLSPVSCAPISGTRDRRQPRCYNRRHEEIASRDALLPLLDDLVAPGKGKVQGDLGRAVTRWYFVV